MSELEARYAFLDALPAKLFAAVVRHVHGVLEPRSTSVVTLRDSLLDGRVPEDDRLRWPEPSFREPMLQALRASGVAELCERNPALSDEVVLFVLGSVDEVHRFYERALVSFAEIACREREVVCVPNGVCAGMSERGGRSAAQWRELFGDAAMEEIREEAMKVAAQMASELLRAQTKARWEETASVLGELRQVFREMCERVRMPPGSAQGLLTCASTQNVTALRRLLAHLRQLHEVIEHLGRERESDDPDAPSVLERIGAIVRRQVEKKREVEDRGAIDVRGVERSNEIARMLPSEAVLLLRPGLRKLWLARWAERGLLTYHARGVWSERIQRQERFEDGLEHEHPRAVRGPVVMIIDTSGSMAGGREALAKAIALQVCAIALGEGRRCYLYNFSGPGDLVEHELAFDGDGLTNLLAFLSITFGGGTVPDEALRRGIARLETDAWKNADLVMLSDGYFDVDPSLISRLRALRRRSDVRVHGVRIQGAEEGDGHTQLGCDEIHDVRLWLSDGAH